MCSELPSAKTYNKDPLCMVVQQAHCLEVTTALMGL